MEGGLPMLNCFLQHTLRSLCTCADSSASSKWVYAVFWRIVPRSYPPPKWDYGGTALDRSKGNKRNWILVWEDGYCDLYECQRTGSGCMKGRFGADIFFKMSHEVYNYGEGLLGKVAEDNHHKWVFKEAPNESDPNSISSWNMTVETQPRAWELQFSSGIQTIAIISVREGIIQMGSFDKIPEDVDLVINIQRKFSYIQSIPGVFAIQRPYLSMQHPCTTNPNSQNIANHELGITVSNDERKITGTKRLCVERLHVSAMKSQNLGWNSTHNGISGPPAWSIPPPLLPTMSCSLGALLSKLPSVIPSYNNIDAFGTTLVNCKGSRTTSDITVKIDDCGVLSEGHQVAHTKMESSCHLDSAQGEEHGSINPSPDLGNHVVGFGTLRKRENTVNLNCR